MSDVTELAENDLPLKHGDLEIDLRAAYDRVADLSCFVTLADARTIAARAIRRALAAEAERDDLRRQLTSALERIGAQSHIITDMVEGTP